MILLSKLEAYGIRGIPLSWFRSYLSNRKQYVALGEAESPKQTMLCGIPQGSTLGPLLFLMYIMICQIAQKNYASKSLQMIPMFSLLQKI